MTLSAIFGLNLICYFLIYNHTAMSAYCSLVVTCWERADLLALFCVVFFCLFGHFTIWCPGSGVVLDCIDFLTLPSFLLKFLFNSLNI